MDLLSPKGALQNLLRSENVEHNLPPGQLATLCRGIDDCGLMEKGAVVAYSGKSTGRIPKDKFIVEDDASRDKVWWQGNSPISAEHFEGIRNKAIQYLSDKKLYVVDALAGADPEFQIRVRFYLERAYHALFVSQLLIQPTPEQLADFEPDWVVIDACRMFVVPSLDGTRTSSAIALNFTSREVLIAGTEYAGELKKSIFTVMNYLLPQQGVMSMHCSANRGKGGDTALFFGLSGTGKTSLSADPNRDLIGDDEHGWSDSGIFNIEGGCYAKCVNLSREHEPAIWDAIRWEAILENVTLDENGVPDYSDTSITENTRVAYPLRFISNAVIPSVGAHPKNIVFLTCDALGLLPPLSLLGPDQVLTYFLNGYSAKVAGTEVGVTEPTLTFSACFGQPFLPLSPQTYGKLLLEKIHRHSARVWLLNTGWTGGPYGVGRRISIEHTRTMLDAALSGELDTAPRSVHPQFGLEFISECPGVPSELLNPGETWSDPVLYAAKAAELQARFDENASKFSLS